MGCELALDFSVFETVDKYNEQFYGLTEAAEEFVDQLDQTRIGRSFLPDVMVCPPRPHSKHSSGGYIGAAQGLIRRSFSGGFKGEFIPSDKHLRLLNGQQNVPYASQVWSRTAQPSGEATLPGVERTSHFILHPVPRSSSRLPSLVPLLSP